MKIRLSVRQKIMLATIGTSITCYIIAMFYIATIARRNAYNDAISLANQSAKNAGIEIENILNAELSSARTLASAFSVYPTMNREQWEKIFVDMYIPVLKKSPNIYTVWDSWELSVIDPNWQKPIGRVMNNVFRDGDKIKVSQKLGSLDVDPDFYKDLKKNRVETIEEPYEDVFADGKNQKLFMTSLIVPIIANNIFTGLVGYDITLNKLQDIVKDIRPFENSFGFLVSNKGIIAGHASEELLNKSVAELFPDKAEENKILEKIENGIAFNIKEELVLGGYNYVTFVPVQVGATTTPWSIVVSVPSTIINQKADKVFYTSIIAAVIMFFVLLFVILYISNTITKPITSFTQSLKDLARGVISDKLKIKLNTGDELEEMSIALSDCVDGLNAKAEFARSIEHGHLDTELKLQSNDDELGQSLAKMQESLISAKKAEELRNQEDKIAAWINEGLNSFANILRQSHENIEELSYVLIYNLVKTLDVNQGGIFLINNDDYAEPVLNRVASYAFDRRKYEKKSFKMGEGLVGACAIEEDSIYIEDVPDDYIEVISGLGGANPSAILLMPIRHENQVLGVIELASFKKFPKHYIDFVDQVARNIGLTLLNVKNTERTNALLTQSKQQSEELAAQEEEMRQNLEELQATQEEASRVRMEQDCLFEALTQTHYIVEYDKKGHVLSVNDKMIRELNINKEEMIGTHHKDSMIFTQEQENNYADFWDQLRKGVVKTSIQKIQRGSQEWILSEIYSPITNASGEVVKIVKLAQNITKDVLN